MYSVSALNFLSAFITTEARRTLRNTKPVSLIWYTQRMPKKSKQNSVAVGLIQMSCGPNPDANFKKAVSRIGEAAKQGAQIVCLQELFRSQYFCQTEDIKLFSLAEPIPGPSTEALGRVAREKKIVIVASLFEKRTAGIYHNTAVIINADGKIAGK